jgi:two-component system, NarL family, response regulator DevR
VDNSTNVFLVCSNRLLRESVCRILSKRADFRVVAGQSLDFDLASETASKADVVVLDSLQLLGENSIFAPERRDIRLINCVLVAMEDDQKRFLAAVRRGVLGYVLQDASAAEVVNAVRSVGKGEAVCPARYALVLFNYFASQKTGSPNSRTREQLGLTRREQELIPLIDRGMTNKEIASQLNLSEQTVKNHVHRILRKMGVQDRLSVSEAFQLQNLQQ